MFPAVFWTQVAPSVRLVEARSGYIVLNIQFPRVELATARMFSRLKIQTQASVRISTHQSQVVEVPIAI